MINILIIIPAFLFMEFVAWFSHKYIMHGFMWNFHKDHHIKSERSGSFFEKNDLFFLIYAIPAMILIILGFAFSLYFLVYAGAGITLYGFTYFLIHDVIIHHRIPVKINIRKGYLAALIRAHEAHHTGRNVRDFRNYGLLVFPGRFLVK
jgi:beta-carotene 3-hydroxylase